MKKETREIFVADDGTVFDKETACVEYEKKIADRIKHTTFWVVHHGPDLTEGRGMMGTTFLEVYIVGWDSYLAGNYVADWCYRTFGRPIAFVQGVSATTAWSYSQLERDAFLMRTKTTKTIYLQPGSKESGLVEVKRPES